MTKKMLILAEKADVAEKLSNAMGWTKDRGVWTGRFENGVVTVVPARGHLVRLQNPDEVIPGLPWNDPNALLSIPKEIPLTVCDDIPGAPEGAQPRVYLERIERLLKQHDELIIATDSDREGEAIGWSIAKYLGYKGPVRRAWFAAGLDKKSLTEAMANLRPPSETKGYYRASQARGHSDWAYMFLVRAYSYFAGYSCFGQHLGRGEGSGSVMSVGRVQSPTVMLVVVRENEIENFVKKDHFVISAEFRPEGGENTVVANYRPIYTQDTIDSQPAGIEWLPHRGVVEENKPVPLDKPLFVDKVKINEFEQRLRSVADQVFISEYEEGLRSEHPPKTFDLPRAQEALGKELGISSGLAQTILEDLYEQGWTSYARTSKAQLPRNLYESTERNAMLSSLYQLDDISDQARFVAGIHNGENSQYRPFEPKIFTNEGMEHYGIIPTTQVMTKTAFNSLMPLKKEAGKSKPLHTADHMKKAYMIIAKQFIQVMYPPAQYSTQKLAFCAPTSDMLGNKESFFDVKAERIVDPGWRDAFKANAEKDTSIAAQRKGGKAAYVQLHLSASTTTPPKRYTDLSLNIEMASIGKYVKNPKYRAALKNSEGIGTPATRKTILPTIIGRGYVELKGDYFHPTPKGRDLMKYIPNWLSNPETTAIWEDYLVKICKEKNDAESKRMRNEFIGKQIERIEDLIKKLIETYGNALGEKVVRQDGRVSPKMQKAIKMIAEKKKITLDKDTLKSFELAKKFLDEHIVRDENPSEAQLALFDSIVANIPSKIPQPGPEVRQSRSAVSGFINDNKRYLPPTPGQIKFAESLRAKLPEGTPFDEDILKYSGDCDKFLKQHTNNSKTGTKTSTMKKGDNKTTGTSGRTARKYSK